MRAEELPRLFSHTRPDGRGPFTALDDLGLSYRRAGENIAYNSGYADTVAQTMSDWMNSPGHRANILNGEFEQVGIGLFQSGRTYYWVQIFYTGSNPSPSQNPLRSPPPAPAPIPASPFTDIHGHWGRNPSAGPMNRGLSAVCRPQHSLRTPCWSGECWQRCSTALQENPPPAPLPASTTYPRTPIMPKPWPGRPGGTSSPAWRRQVRAVLSHHLGTAGSDAVPLRKSTGSGSGQPPAFSDGEAVSPWARDAVQWAVNRGIPHRKGFPPDPQGRATAPEAAAMLQRFAG